MSPLVSLSLERSLSLAEAMEARGYGGGPRTRMPPPQLRARERVVAGCGAAATLLAVWLLAGGGADYHYYDLLGDPVTAAAVGGSIALAALTAIEIGAIRWPR